MLNIIIPDECGQLTLDNVTLSVTYGKTTVKERLRCLDSYAENDDKGNPFIDEDHFNDSEKKYFELWREKHLIGLLNADLTSDNNGINITINSIVIINHWQGNNYSHAFVDAITNPILNAILDIPKAEKPTISFNADIISETGNIFMQNLTVPFEDCCWNDHIDAESLHFNWSW